MISKCLENNRSKSQFMLGVYDFAAFLCVEMLLLFVYRRNENPLPGGVGIQVVTSFVCIFGVRIFGGVYHQIWRYGGIQSYMKLLAADSAAFFLSFCLGRIIAVGHIPFSMLLLASCVNLLCSLTMRMIYHYAYKCGNDTTAHGRFLKLLLRIFARGRLDLDSLDDSTKVNVAIVGAGKVGATLAQELFSNAYAEYIPRCFIDTDKEKVGREIHGIPVLACNEKLWAYLEKEKIENVILAIPALSDSDKKSIAGEYLNKGLGVKIYDYPEMRLADGKCHLREFTIEDLLFRKPVRMLDERTAEYYRGKTVLVTGGGGSIGTELCRQLAGMQPAKIVILDICENGAYDIQQELWMKYRDELNVAIEIVSITNRDGLARVFGQHHPQIVVNAAAHKHVPLMEHNCIEAVENNVFGTCNLVELCEEYCVERFLMVSTDKAVNPTNVMGATKRVCEMVVLGASTYGSVKYSATRFGNVLGSAGSVIPLFKKQIACGGPITLTDRRITRFFMTIPEAVQLILQSGAMADNGELFVLDMGQPVKILDLAENMIRMSGAKGIEITEIGLRPGEKLYEELLIKTEKMTKTENDLIYIEKDTPLEKEQVEDIIGKLKWACATNDDRAVCQALKEVVPEYRDPEEVNVSDEMKAESKPDGSAESEEGRMKIVYC